MVRGESKDVVEAAQILNVVAEHVTTAKRTRVAPQSVNVTFIPGLGDEQAAVNAIRAILEGNPNIVDLLRVPGEQQVMLMVTVAEVNRTAARTIGMDFSIVNGAFAFAQTTGGQIAAARRRPPARRLERPARRPRRWPRLGEICPPRSTMETC